MNVFAKLLFSVVMVFSLPLQLVNLFFGVAAGIWLAILGEWEIIGYGAVLIVIAAIMLNFALAIGSIIGAPASYFLVNGSKLGFYAFGILPIIYGILLVSSINAFILYDFSNLASAESLLPALTWSYGIALGVTSYLTNKEIQGGNKYAIITVTFNQAAYIAAIIYIMQTTVSFIMLMLYFAFAELIGRLIELFIEFKLNQSID